MRPTPRADVEFCLLFDATRDPAVRGQLVVPGSRRAAPTHAALNSGAARVHGRKRRGRRPRSKRSSQRRPRLKYRQIGTILGSSERRLEVLPAPSYNLTIAPPSLATVTEPTGRIP